MEQLLTNLFGSQVVTQILLWGSIIITVATAIVKLTPNETDNKYLEYFVKFFELIGGNTKPINSDKK